jgi:uncharacterized protein YfiM (DUF2279 family)
MYVLLPSRAASKAVTKDQAVRFKAFAMSCGARGRAVGEHYRRENDDTRDAHCGAVDDGPTPHFGDGYVGDE